MCLIILCPQGTDKYSELVLESIKRASKTNTDGIGFAYKRAKSPDKVYIDKGFTTADNFIKVYKQHRLVKGDEVMIHLRIGNKGAVNTDMNHPFVLSSDKDTILSRTKLVELPVLVHNGTFHGYARHNDPMSDTYYFVRDMMSYKYIQDFLVQEPEGFKKLFSTTISTNKLGLIFPGKTEMVRVGYFLEDSGYYFSNVSYKEDRYKNVGGFESYDDDDYYNNYSTRNRHVQRAELSTLKMVTALDLEPDMMDSVISKNTCRSLYKYNRYLWVPFSFKDTQAEESLLMPMRFNYKHYKLTSYSTDLNLGLMLDRTYNIVECDDIVKDNQCHILKLTTNLDPTSWADTAYVNDTELAKNCRFIIEPLWKPKYTEMVNLIRHFKGTEITRDFYDSIKKTIDGPSGNIITFKSKTGVWKDTLKLWYNYLTVENFPDNEKELYKIQNEDAVAKDVEPRVYVD